MKSKEPGEMKKQTALCALCTICGQPATRLVDSEPSCDEHAELIYENQLEDYTKAHLAKDEWLEKSEVVEE